MYNLLQLFYLQNELIVELLEVSITAGNTGLTTDIPGFLCSEFERPDKKIAIKDKQTRYNAYYDKPYPVYDVDGYVVLILVTAHDGNTTCTSFPSHCQHHWVSWRYATCLYFLQRTIFFLAGR